jgi:hypothetical protein
LASILEPSIPENPLSGLTDFDLDFLNHSWFEDTILSDSGFFQDKALFDEIILLPENDDYLDILENLDFQSTKHLSPQGYSCLSTLTANKHSPSPTPKPPKQEPKKAPPRYPCPLCSKYDGPRAFKRKDHQLQHLRTLHSVPKEKLNPGFCPHSGCPKSAVNAATQIFTTIVQYRHHLKDAHEESMFECNVQGCNRVGRNGFARETNLTKHIEKEHSTNWRGREDKTIGFGKEDPLGVMNTSYC